MRTRLAFLSVGVLVLLAPPAAAQPTTITGCTTIESPGVYTLGPSFDGNGGQGCIEVAADSVRLDGNGRTLGGLILQNQNNVTVENLAQRGTLTIRNAENVSVADLTVHNVPFGNAVLVRDTNRVALRNVTVDGAPEAGVRLRNAERTVVSDTVVRNAGSTGISMMYGDATVVNTTVVDAGATGIGAYQLSQVTLRNNTVENATESGIAVQGRTTGPPTDATASGNAVFASGTGRAAMGFEDLVDARIHGNTVVGGGDGIRLFGGENVTLSNNRIRNVTQDGLDVDSVQNVTANGLGV